MTEERRETRRMGRVSEDEDRLSYGSYLRLPELLDLQSLLSDPPAHDELLFIIVHQAYELWFKELVFELESVRDLMFERNVARARHFLTRVHAIERLMTQQIEILETMDPQDFLAFRSNLDPASGFQSVQFREVEFLSGLRDPRYAKLAETEAERERLGRRLEEPTLWDAFRDLLDHNGLPMPADDLDARAASLQKLARNRDAFPGIWYLADDLLVHDELFMLWRQRHILMVERQIGSKTGTGGSSGASYLRTTLDKRFYPELWDIRSNL
ncbi:MAG TPA: tryptophan 2,3-dioxygenase family protein [Actinomycetota bacterium]|jgi:tryptophan 2,3-dioxygenase